VSSERKVSPQSSQEVGGVGPTFDGGSSLEVLKFAFVPKVVKDFLAMDVKGVEYS
jgi:hypothetical protein